MGSGNGAGDAFSVTPGNSSGAAAEAALMAAESSMTDGSGSLTLDSGE